MLIQLLSPLASAALQLGLSALPLAPPPPPIVELEEVLEDPSLFFGRPVRTYVQVHSEVGEWNAYMLRFGPAAYRALNVWSDQQMLWDRADYEAPLARLFLSRQRPLALGRARSQERFLCTVVVRDWFAGQPWIEVQRAIRTRRQLPAGALLAAIRAGELVERGAFGLALGEFDRALAAGLPGPAEDSLAEAREACAALQEGTGRPVEALVRRPARARARDQAPGRANDQPR